MGEFNLERFVHAQESTYEGALDEIRAGRKEDHWMWFIFPQVAGLGRSQRAIHYAIGSASEASAYLAHPVLGPRLQVCAAAVLANKGRSAVDIFGTTDARKLISSATLFASVLPPGSLFEQLLDEFNGGRRDEATLRLLGASPPR